MNVAKVGYIVTLSFAYLCFIFDLSEVQDLPAG